MNEPEMLKSAALKKFQDRRYEEALAIYETAVSAFADHGNELGQAEMLNNIGVIHRIQGHSKEAIEALSEAEALFSRLEDPGGRGQVLANLGDVHAANKDRQQAEATYWTASSLLAQSGDRARQSQVLRAISLLKIRQGRWIEAMIQMEQSIAAAPRPSIGQRLFRLLLKFALGVAQSG